MAHEHTVKPHWFFGVRDRGWQSEPVQTKRGLFVSHDNGWPTEPEPDWVVVFPPRREFLRTLPIWERVPIMFTDALRKMRQMFG